MIMTAQTCTLLLLMLVYKLAFAQTQLGNNSSGIQNTYYHNESPSFKSKLYRLIIWLKGIKSQIEREFEKRDFQQVHQPAPIPGSVKKGCDIAEKISSNGRTVWTLTKKNSSASRFILYLHGGAFVHNISTYDWCFLHRLIEQTNYAVIVPDYPLAPVHNYEDVYEMLFPLYKELVDRVGSENSVIMGFSAGGGMALSLAQYVRSEDLPQPSRLVVLSPFLDGQLVNPDILVRDRSDPYLSVDGCKLAAAAYAGDIPLDHWMISPIYGSLRGLAPIHMFMGTDEIFVPDARKLMEKAQVEDAQVNYYEYHAMYHAWIFLNMPEAKMVFKQLTRLLK